ncbi:LptF/LptG family permease [Shimia litoralis]|uniref:LptF/LptG family permease n=1 Tax=Shimia litoralis TaxID=420403 RepID=A0A4U7MW48_9RHOB|nr:LptF/LptG family permease [Shimia litoralis]TKZ17372.1 LptF/LptG family permease [Shimia litoralis]
MIRFGPIVALLGTPILARLLLLLGLVVAIFLADSFTSLLEGIMRYGGDPKHLALLLMLKSPEIVDMALAIGMLIAVYFALLEARNSGELIILATAGVRWSRIVGFVLLVGVLGGVVSFATAGYVLPKARFAQRIVLAELRKDYVLDTVTRSGPRRDQHSIKGTSFIATPPKDDSQERGQLFIFQPQPDGSWRAGQSRNWHIVGPDDTGTHRIRLKALKAYESPARAADGKFRPISAFQVSDADFEFRLDDIAPPPDQRRSKAEQILDLAPENEKRMASVLARAQLVPAAALLAVIAVLTSGAGIMRYLTLPIAAITVMVYDVLGRAILMDLIGTAPPVLLGGSAVVVYLVPLLGYIALRGEALMVPVKAKS